MDPLFQGMGWSHTCLNNDTPVKYLARIEGRFLVRELIYVPDGYKVNSTKCG